MTTTKRKRGEIITHELRYMLSKYLNNISITINSIYPIYDMYYVCHFKFRVLTNFSLSFTIQISSTLHFNIITYIFFLYLGRLYFFLLFLSSVHSLLPTFFYVLPVFLILKRTHFPFLLFSTNANIHTLPYSLLSENKILEPE